MAYMPEGLVLHQKYTGQSVQRRGTIIDRSGNGNAGTVYGAPALSFDGTNDKAAVATPWDSLGGHRYAWFASRIKPAAQAASRCLWHDTWNGTQTSKFLVAMSATDKLEITVRTGASGDTSRSATSSESITEGSWSHLLCAVDLGTDGTVANGLLAYVWVDGVALTMGAFNGDAAQGTWAADVSNYQGMGTLDSGIFDWEGLANWIGYGGMDALPTITDAQQFYDNAQAWLSQAGLDAWWPCSEGAGATVDNAEGTAGHDLNLTGTTWDVWSDNGGNAYLQTGGAGDSFYTGGRWFDGNDDTVVVTDAAELRPGTGEFQIHIWAKCDSNQVNGNGVFIGKGKFGVGEWMFRLQLTAAEYRLSFYGDAGGINIQEAAGVNRADDTLHLFSVIRTGTGVRIYIDTVIPTNGSDASAGDDLNDAANLEVGSSNSEAGRCLSADIYQVFYSKKTMTLAAGRAEMAAIYAQGAYA